MTSIFLSCGLAMAFCFNASGAEANQKLSEILAENGVAVDWPASAKAEAFQQRKSGEMSFLTVRAAGSGSKQVEFEIIAPIENNAAMAMFNIKRRAIQSSYANHPTPYAGEVTNTTICPEQFQPHNIEAANSVEIDNTLIARANQRRAWGNCTEDPNALIGATAFFYDHQNKRLVQMTIFEKSKNYSEKSVNEILKSFHFK